MPARSPHHSAMASSVDITDSSDDDQQSVSSRGTWQRGPQSRAETGSSSAHSSRRADPSSSELSDDGDARSGQRRVAAVYKTPSRGQVRAGESPVQRYGGTESRPTTAGMNRGLGGRGADDDIEKIEQAIDRQQHSIKRAGHNAVNRALNAARSHTKHPSSSEISASSEEERRPSVSQSVSQASRSAVHRSKVGSCSVLPTCSCTCTTTRCVPPQPTLASPHGFPLNLA